MVDQEELAICKRRGHDVVHLIEGKWSQCESCGTWVRRIWVIEECEGEPPEKEMHHAVVVPRLLERASGQEKRRGTEWVDHEELAICKRRGHNLGGLDVADLWRRCESCRMWVRMVLRTIEERDDDPETQAGRQLAGMEERLKRSKERSGE
jgi:hypothetical protein